MMKAFSLIELLVVMAIIAIIGGTASPFLSNYIVRNSLRQAEDNLISYLRKAQSYSMSSKNGQIWGVCLANNNINLFYTACAEASIIDRYPLPRTIQLTGLNELSFSKNGAASSNATLILQSAIDSKTIILNGAGGLTRQN